MEISHITARPPSVYAETTVGSLLIRSTIETVGAYASLADVSVSVSDRVLRVVVTDPVRTWPDDMRVGAHAGAVSQGALRSAAAVEEGMSAANALLHSPYRGWASGASMARVGVVEVELLGLGVRAEAWRAGGCEVWALTGGVWRPVFATDTLTPEARRRWASNRLDAEDQASYLAAYDTLLSSIDDWVSAPLGLHDIATYEYAAVKPAGQIDGVAIFTDEFGAGVPDVCQRVIGKGDTAAKRACAAAVITRQGDA